MSVVLRQSSTQRKRARRTFVYDRGQGTSGASINGRLPEIGPGAWSILTGTVTTNGIGQFVFGSSARAVIDTSKADCIIYMRWQVADQNSNGGPIVRYVAGTPTFYAVELSGGYTTWTLYRVTGTTYQGLTGGAWPYGNNAVDLMITLSGATITMTANGVTTLTTSSATVGQSSTIHGCTSHSVGTNLRIWNIQVTA